jgi:hypothetical protein
MKRERKLCGMAGILELAGAGGTKHWVLCADAKTLK